MKPFIVYSALVLAILFLGGALLAGAELVREGNLLTNPKIKPALGFLVTGVMFLGIGLRGLRSRKQTNPSALHSTTPKTPV
jgi:hypothetical protein